MKKLSTLRTRTAAGLLPMLFLLAPHYANAMACVVSLTHESNRQATTRGFDIERLKASLTDMQVSQAQTLIHLGYAPEVAFRMVHFDPSLAARSEQENTHPSTYYRGMMIDPTSWIATMGAPYVSGDQRIAVSYAQGVPSNFDPNRKDDFVPMVFEYQYPSTLSRDGGKAHRLATILVHKVNDERAMIRRVGVVHYGDNGMADYRIDWLPFEAAFSEIGELNAAVLRAMQKGASRDTLISSGTGERPDSPPTQPYPNRQDPVPDSSKASYGRPTWTSSPTSPTVTSYATGVYDGRIELVRTGIYSATDLIADIQIADMSFGEKKSLIRRVIEASQQPPDKTFTVKLEQMDALANEILAPGNADQFVSTIIRDFLKR